MSSPYINVPLKATKPHVHKAKCDSEPLPLYYYAAGVGAALVLCYVVYKGQEWQKTS